MRPPRRALLDGVLDFAIRARGQTRRAVRDRGSADGAAFLDLLATSLAADGWKDVSGEGGLPGFHALFHRPFGDGWATTLEVLHDDRELVELPRWEHGMRAAVSVTSGVELLAARELAVTLGMPVDPVGLMGPDLYRGTSEPRATRQIRGPVDHAPVVAQVREFATRIAQPWAEAHADLDACIAEEDRLALAESEEGSWSVPVALVAAGRMAEARRRLARDREVAEDVAEHDAFTAALLGGAAGPAGAAVGTADPPDPHVAAARYATSVARAAVALAAVDPTGLRSPDIDLEAEYEREAAEIARRMLRGEDAMSAVREVLEHAFHEAPAPEAVDAVARRLGPPDAGPA